MFSDFEALGIIKYDFLLSNVTSMKTGGVAKYAFFPENKFQLRDVILFLKNNNIKYCVIGNASNILFMDSGYDGAVVFTGKMKAFGALPDSFDKDTTACDDGKLHVYAEAGASLTSFTYKTLKDGYAGLEFAYGIPATVGGAIYMNAGAYGGEISNVLEAVEYLDADGEFKVYRNSCDKCGFSYRHSPFTGDKDKIIVGGIFALPGDKDGEAMKIAEKNMASRREKQPLEYPSCGSAFKRPEGHFAGTLIEGAGLKGKGIGGAFVSEKHAGFIINKGGATSSDVIAMLDYVKNTVLEKYGVELEPEIVIVK